MADTPLSNDAMSKLVFQMGELLAKKIDDAPGVDAEPVRHGRWIETKTGFHCSVCKKKPGIHSTKRGADLSEYCHRCGAKMDGDANAPKS